VLKELKTLKQAISASALFKTYETSVRKITVLDGVDFEVGDGELMVLRGPSGSGKTTLLNIVSGIDKPTSGELLVYGERLTEKSEDFLSDFRCNNVGYVFQSYNLVSTLTVAENIAFPMEWLKKPRETIEDRLKELLEIVSLQDRAEHFPYQLSGGEEQRVAFARALANDPPLVLADEPTGNLDQKTGAKIIELLGKLRKDGRTVVVATHDAQISKLADKSCHLEAGKLMSSNE
jgi:putative ABC transport system ATP-binding protein